MKKILSSLVWSGLVVASALAIGCSEEKTPTSSAPPPAAAGGASTAPAAATSEAPIVFTSTGPDGQLLPGWAKWQGKKSPVPSDEKTLAEGQKIYVTNCAPCHGEKGIGDGPAGVAFDPKPRNLTVGQYKFGGEEWQLFRTVWEGVPAPSGMAKWDGRMSEKDAWTVVMYIKSMAPKK